MELRTLQKCQKKIEENNSRILCLDLGTTTGWAFIDEFGEISSGTISFKTNRFTGGGMRYLWFNQWLERFSGSLDAIYFEEVRRHLGVDAAHAYGGFLGILTAWCEKEPVPYQGIPVGTIKKFITNKGNASKDAIIKAVREKGHTPKDDNEADAIALLYYSIAI